MGKSNELFLLLQNTLSASIETVIFLITQFLLYALKQSPQTVSKSCLTAVENFAPS